MKIKKDDHVRVIAGADKGKEGKVIQVNLKNNTLLVEGVNMVTKHSKPSGKAPSGGKIHQEGPIHVSNVMYLLKGKPTRIGFQVEQSKGEKAKKVRIAKSTGDVID